MQRPLELVIITLTILEIAYEVGYENPSKFSKVFKKYYGLLPSKFKEYQ